MDAIYRVVIENHGKKIELESSDPKWIEKQKSELVKNLNLYEKATLQESIPLLKGPTSSKQKRTEGMSINEFYRTYCKDLRSNTNTAVFFLYYLNWVNKKNSATSADIRDLFVTAKIPKAAGLNYSDILAKAKKRALVNQIDNNWSLTITGEDYVMNKMQTSETK